MERNISIQLGDEKAIAVLLDDKAPKTCDLIWRSLPYEAEVHHAKLCKNELIFMVPMVMDTENAAVPVAGDIGYWVVRQCVNIWYDEMKPLGSTNLFGKVVKNLDGLRREARKVWYKPGNKIRMDRI